MEMIFMNTEHSNTNELHRLVPNLSQRLGLGSSNEHVAPTWTYTFELADSSYSLLVIQDYYIIKNHETLSTKPSYSYLHQQD